MCFPLYYLDIPWPDGEEAMSEDAQEAINSLLTMDPSDRPTSKGTIIRHTCVGQNRFNKRLTEQSM